jgi:Family of unknown function (DUF6763)
MNEGGFAMPMDTDPVVGAVYENADGRTFEVIGFDENEANIQLRYDDGTMEDIDLDAWYEMDLEPVSFPDEDAEDDETEETPEADDEYPEDDEDEDEDDYYEEGNG